MPNTSDHQILQTTVPSAEDHLANRCLDPVEKETVRDMRRYARLAVGTKLLVAAVKNDLMPWPDDFIEVECRDVSQGGISVFMKAFPNFRELVVCLGHDLLGTLMLARVVRVQEVRSGARHGFTVGCQFTERVTFSDEHGIRRNSVCQRLDESGHGAGN